MGIAGGGEKVGQKKWNDQQTNMTKNDRDLIAETGGKKIDEKTSRNIATGLTIAAAASILLFGIVGGMICFAGCWAVCAICKSRLPLVAKIILGIVAGLAALAFLIMVILLSAATVTE